MNFLFIGELLRYSRLISFGGMSDKPLEYSF
jgi:hypothetical protein